MIIIRESADDKPAAGEKKTGFAWKPCDHPTPTYDWSKIEELDPPGPEIREVDLLSLDALNMLADISNMP